MVLADAARLAILLHDSHNFDFFAFAAADTNTECRSCILLRSDVS